MSPANIENTILAACPMVGVMMAIGDGRTYNTALLVFDADSLGPYAAQRGLDASPAALAADPEVIAHRRRRGRGQRQIIAGRTDQAVPHIAHPVGARRGRDNPDDETQAPSNRREIFRGDRGALRQRAETAGLRARCRAIDTTGMTGASQ